MAAFNPKPWFKQPAGIEFNLKGKIIPYFVDIDKDIPKFLPKAFTSENKDGIFYENISYSYEIFNGLIVWGLIEYPKLHKFFMNDLKIYGPKISFDRDIFKPLNPINEFLYLKDIRKKTMPYHKLSISQKRMNNLLVDYDYAVNKIKGDILSVCRRKKINRYGDKSYNPRIIEYNQDYVEKIKAQTKKKYKSKKNTRRKSRKKTKRKTRKGKSKQEIKVLYFTKENCTFCKDFNLTWNLLKKQMKNIHFIKINGEKNKALLHKYNIESYPTIIKIVRRKSTKFPSDDRNLNDLKKFIKK
jgi:thiol-disulfide isomerase/thioredoxin